MKLGLGLSRHMLTAENFAIAKQAGVRLALHPDDPPMPFIRGQLYAVVEQYPRQNRLGYVHLRNIRDKVPHYKETFIDDGEVDVLRVLAILKKNKFEGVIIPDHAPQMSCAAPWHAGMAYALGFMKAGMMALEGKR